MAARLPPRRQNFALRPLAPLPALRSLTEIMEDELESSQTGGNAAAASPGNPGVSGDPGTPGAGNSPIGNSIMGQVVSMSPLGPLAGIATREGLNRFAPPYRPFNDPMPFDVPDRGYPISNLGIPVRSLMTDFPDDIPDDPPPTTLMGVIRGILGRTRPPANEPTDEPDLGLPDSVVSDPGNVGPTAPPDQGYDDDDGNATGTPGNDGGQPGSDGSGTSDGAAGAAAGVYKKGGKVRDRSRLPGGKEPITAHEGEHVIANNKDMELFRPLFEALNHHVSRERLKRQVTKLAKRL